MAEKVQDKPLQLEGGKVIELLADIRAILARDAEREKAYQRKSKFTALEAVKLNVSTTMNVPLDVNSGKFTLPVSDWTIQLISISGGGTCYVSFNVPANTTGAGQVFEFTAVGQSFSASDFPVQDVYAIMSTGTARIQVVGQR